jgi:cytosine/adenosine deaminase-related metal-dependent hydrolase
VHTLDARGAVVHPGFIDAHCHVTLHTTRGVLPEKSPGGKGPGPFDLWMNAIEPEDERISTMHGALEMLRNGFTAFMDPGTAYEPDAVAEAATAVGIRATVGEPFLWDVTDILPTTRYLDRVPATTKRSIQLLGSELGRNEDPDSLVRGHVALYGAGSASEELLRAAKDCADRNGAVLTAHQSFNNGDTRGDDRRFGRHPLVHFAEMGVLGENCTFVHMNIVRDDEVPAVVESGMSIVWHPGNYQFYAISKDMRGRMHELWDKGVNLTLGVDVAKAWTFGDLGLVAYLVAREEGGLIPAEGILEMQTIRAAKAVGMGGFTGSLEAGKRADIVIRSNDLPESRPGLNMLRELVLVSRSKSVDTVIVDGRVVLRRGQPVLVDEDAVYAQSRESARRLAGKAGFAIETSWPKFA